MRIGLVLLIVLTVIGISSVGFINREKMANTYEVEVRVKLGNQSTVIKQLVEANSSTSAQNEAERLVRYRIQTSVKSCRQLK